jgi:hypothetical protein
MRDRECEFSIDLNGLVGPDALVLYKLIGVNDGIPDLAGYAVGWSVKPDALTRQPDTPNSHCLPRRAALTTSL